MFKMDKNVERVFIDGLRVTALVDTKTVISVISETLRKRLRKVVMPHNGHPLRGVGSDLLHPVGMCT